MGKLLLQSAARLTASFDKSFILTDHIDIHILGLNISFIFKSGKRRLF